MQQEQEERNWSRKCLKVSLIFTCIRNKKKWLQRAL